MLHPEQQLFAKLSAGGIGPNMIFTGMMLPFLWLSNCTASINSWTGLVADTDGSVDESSETMGAGYAIGDAPLPIRVFSASVGGPLASVRAEAASLLQLLYGM